MSRWGQGKRRRRRRRAKPMRRASSYTTPCLWQLASYCYTTSADAAKNYGRSHLANWSTLQNKCLVTQNLESCFAQKWQAPKTWKIACSQNMAKPQYSTINRNSFSGSFPNCKKIPILSWHMDIPNSLATSLFAICLSKQQYQEEHQQESWRCRKMVSFCHVAPHLQMWWSMIPMISSLGENTFSLICMYGIMMPYQLNILNWTFFLNTKDFAE